MTWGSTRNRRRGVVVLGLVCMAGLGSTAVLRGQGAAETPDPKALIGTWKVDRRPKPGAPDYFKEFRVDSVDGKVFTGKFYDTDLEDGRLNADWGAVYFAFVTRDGSGEYHHSGALRDGKLEGLSHSIGRKFLLPWRAAR